MLSTCSFTRSASLAFIELTSTPFLTLTVLLRQAIGSGRSPYLDQPQKRGRHVTAAAPYSLLADPNHSLRKFLSAMLPYSLKVTVQHHGDLWIEALPASTTDSASKSSAR